MMIKQLLQLMFIRLCKWLMNNVQFIYKQYLDDHYEVGADAYKPLRLCNSDFLTGTFQSGLTSTSAQGLLTRSRTGSAPENQI